MYHSYPLAPVPSPTGEFPSILGIGSARPVKGRDKQSQTALDRTTYLVRIHRTNENDWSFGRLQIPLRKGLTDTQEGIAILRYSNPLLSPVSVLALSVLSRVKINGRRTPALDRTMVLVTREVFLLPVWISILVSVLISFSIPIQISIPVIVICIYGGLRYLVVKFGRVNFFRIV